MNYVQISNDKNSFFLPTSNNKISLKTIKTYFPDASGLTYKFQEEIRCVNIVNDNFELIDYVTEYKVFYADSNKGVYICICIYVFFIIIRSRYMCIYKCIQLFLLVNATKHDNLIMEIIEKHKSKSSSNLVKKKKRASDGSKTKELTVGWKHKGNIQDAYKLMPEPVGGCKKINLDLDEDYSYEDIKNLCIQYMKNDDNENFFKNSTIQLGNFQNSIFSNFTTEDEKNCDSFWEFFPNVRTRNGQLRLYLLTT